MRRFIAFGFIGLVAAGAYLYGNMEGLKGNSAVLLPEVEASSTAEDWSRTGVAPDRDVYFPGTEELAPDEMRVIACGSGMPMPRLKQAAACMLIELGNGDKFIFDMGTGSMERLYALGIPLDYIDKVFLSHLHADHMGDLPAF
jgi:ribonuclease Z